MIEKGANINAITKRGFTALLYASERGHVEICNLLIEKSADVPELNKNITKDFKICWNDVIAFKQNYDKARNISRTKLIKEELMTYIWNPEREYTKWALIDEFNKEF